MKKLPIFLLIGILALAFVLSGCNREKTAAIYSCCDIGCTSSLPCSQYTCPNNYHYESLVDQCIKNDGSSMLGQVCFPNAESYATHCNTIVKDYSSQKCDFGTLLNKYFDCAKVPQYTTACGKYSSSYLCKNAMAFSYDGGDSFSLYCKVEDVVVCEGKCEKGLCTQGIPVPDCSNGYMKCEGQDVYKCVSGAWQKQTTCSGTDTCEERTYNNAWCSPQWKYCIGQNAPNCVLCDVCSGLDGGCDVIEYDTQEECLNQVNYYCLNSEDTSCTKRTSCLSGEQSFWANRLAGGLTKSKELCESQICGKENSKCCADKKCNFGLSCQPEEGMQDVYGNQAYHCVKSSDCEGMCADNAWLSLGGKVLVPNYMCIWSCQLAQYFIWLKIGLTVVAGLITMLTSLYFLRSKFPKKKDQTMVWVITLLLTGIMAALFYFYFIIWVIAFILYLIIMIVIKNIKPF